MIYLFNIYPLTIFKIIFLIVYKAIVYDIEQCILIFLWNNYFIHQISQLYWKILILLWKLKCWLLVYTKKMINLSIRNKIFSCWFFFNLGKLTNNSIISKKLNFFFWRKSQVINTVSHYKILNLILQYNL